MKSSLANDETYQAIFQNITVDTHEAASFILWNIWKERKQPAELEFCLAAVRHDNALYDTLKACHEKGKYNEIRNWKISTDRAPPSKGDDDAVKNVVHGVLEKLGPAIMKFLRGETALPAWLPSMDNLDPDTYEHLTSLKIPCHKGKPNLLLHGLGSFAQDDTLNQRVKNIFMSDTHTFLVNTSGSGKTRLLLEGLCEHWGFYFTSLVDSSLLGSVDIQQAIKTHLPQPERFCKALPERAYENALHQNRELADRIFKRVLLARLLVFDLFTREMTARSTKHQEHPTSYRKQWLLFQLQPSCVDPKFGDVFEELCCILARASDEFIDSTTDELFRKVRTACSAVEPPQPSLPSTPSTSRRASPQPCPSIHKLPFFCVLDEAQFAASQHTKAFRSSDGVVPRPVLREIVSTWDRQTAAHYVFMVVAGTGVSKDIVERAMSSGIMKDSKYRWVSDTGAFDEKEEQRAYLEKYVGRRWLETDSGKRLVDRVWHWLRGRYRFTSAYVSDLVAHRLRQPHRLLDAYIHHFTKFKVTDARAFVDGEGNEPLPQFYHHILSFSKLEKNSNMLETIKRFTINYLLRSTLLTLGKDEETFVEFGFARFVKHANSSGTQFITIDEPLILLGVMPCIKSGTRYSLVANSLRNHEPNSNGFENYVAFCLDFMFCGHQSKSIKLADVFDFIPRTKPAWAELEAELVSVHRTNSGAVEVNVVKHFEHEGPSVALGMNASSAEETIDWLNHESSTPFLFPLNGMGPDLIFVLRLSDGTLIWVVLQAKYSTQPRRLNGRLPKQALKTVTPGQFWKDKDGNAFSPTSHPNIIEETIESLLALPQRREDAGRHCLLRVLASFPAETDLENCLTEDPDTGHHPVASLNMRHVKYVTKKMNPENILQQIEDGIHKATAPKKRAKRKTAQELAGPKRKKRKSLNI